MATVVGLKFCGIPPVKYMDESLQTAFKFVRTPGQHQLLKFMFPLVVVKSMKISGRCLKSTYNMSTSNLRVKVRASHIQNTEMSSEPVIGVSVFILKDNKILFGRRRSVAVGDKTYLLPGGHLESGESYMECATREVKEETGLDIKNIDLLTTTNNLYYEAKHLEVTFVRAYLSDENQSPQNIEPDKCEGWDWYDMNNLPEPMFGPLQDMFQEGFDPFHIES